MLQNTNTFIVSDPKLLPSPESQHFDPEFWRRGQMISGKEHGRGTTYFLRPTMPGLPEAEWVLRHYLRGGLIGKLIRDLYLFTGAKNTRSLAEFQVLSILHQQGLPVPRPVAALAKRKGLVYRADILIEKIPGARDLCSVLQAPADAAFYRNLGELVARFHSAGVYHADLNIKNILLDADHKLWLIDFDRAQLGQCTQAKQDKSLARLKRSFEKERGRRGVKFQETDWLVFLETYQQARKN